MAKTTRTEWLSAWLDFLSVDCLWCFSINTIQVMLFLLALSQICHCIEMSLGITFEQET